jgi:hypothetical protein
MNVEQCLNQQRKVLHLNSPRNAWVACTRLSLWCFHIALSLVDESVPLHIAQPLFSKLRSQYSKKPGSQNYCCLGIQISRNLPIEFSVWETRNCSVGRNHSGHEASASNSENLQPPGYAKVHWFPCMLFPVGRPTVNLLFEVLLITILIHSITASTSKRQ